MATFESQKPFLRVNFLWGKIKHPVLWHYTCNQHKYEIPLMIQEWDPKVWIIRENNHMCILSLTTSTVINDISSESILTSLADVGKNPPLHSPSNISNMQLSYIKIEPGCKSPPKSSYKNCHSTFWHLLAEVSQPYMIPPDPLSTCVIYVRNAKPGFSIVENCEN